MPRRFTGKSKAKKRAEPRVSNVVKPVGLSAEDWQLKLRQQAARSEMLWYRKSMRFRSRGSIG